MAGILSVLYIPSWRFRSVAPVHLLFINLLTDSLPAIAIGMEPAEKDLLSQKPRNSKEGILTKEFMMKLILQGRPDRCLYHDSLPSGTEPGRRRGRKHHGVLYADTGASVPWI